MEDTAGTLWSFAGLLVLLRAPFLKRDFIEYERVGSVRDAGIEIPLPYRTLTFEEPLRTRKNYPQCRRRRDDSARHNPSLPQDTDNDRSGRGTNTWLDPDPNFP